MIISHLEENKLVYSSEQNQECCMFMAITDIVTPILQVLMLTDRHQPMIILYCPWPVPADISLLSSCF